MVKTTIISYSFTGNNDKLAEYLARQTGADHIRVTEPQKRTFGKIAFDRLYGRTPRINESLEKAGMSDFILFIGPVWMYQIASPLRSCFKQLRRSRADYAFASISGGADGPDSNSGLRRELTKRMKREPRDVFDLHIAANLLPADPKPTRDDTSVYKVTAQDIEFLGNKVLQILPVASR